MLKPMPKPLVTMALLAAFGVAGAQAQTPSDKAPPGNPSVAMQMTAPSGADARKLLGRNIKNMQNETIGEVRSIHLDPSGKVDAVIVSVGGFLGVGDREVLLDWRELQIDANGEVVHVNMTRDRLKAKAPYSYTEPGLRGTVFTDKGVYTPDRANRSDRTSRTDTASIDVPTRSTGDFNVAGQMSAQALIGKTVKNATNENVGKIDDFIMLCGCFVPVAAVDRIPLLTLRRADGGGLKHIRILALLTTVGLGHEFGVAAEQNVGAAAGHVGGDGNSSLAAGLGDDESFALVVLGVQDFVPDAHFLQNPG